MKLVVEETGQPLGDSVATADTFIGRFRGLMLTEQLPEGHGLHIRPCRSVHSFFMNYPIDVLHLDEFGTIVGMELALQPGRIGKSFRRTHSVVELPAGTLYRANARIGQRVNWE